MALTEQKVLSQITALPESSTFNVQWKNQILKDGEVIASTYERKCYAIEQKDEFLLEVEGAASYITSIGWGL